MRQHYVLGDDRHCIDEGDRATAIVLMQLGFTYEGSAEHCGVCDVADCKKRPKKKEKGRNA